ncbi:hypothetical protein RJ639_010451 [Escallonia herrerae]|uniref:Cytochrome P450 n=1 Tax=Escallonia herrerae TaxID=1293975 RepID=A0AA89AR97_9ASTE|nr:hypothetical protein RJ639_010451 [Escallonia herrerae]
MEILSFLYASLLFLIFIHGLELFRRRKLPPGPIGLPLLGNLLEIGPKPHAAFAKLAKKYGPLMTIRLGSVTNVVASVPDMAREILQKNDESFSGRTTPDAIAELDHADHAVAWISAGNVWRAMRKVLTTYLTNKRKLDSLRDLRQKVVEEMVQHVHGVSQRGEAVEIGKLAFTASLNQMSNTCYSVNVADFKSEDVRGFQKAVKTVMEVDAQFNIVDYFPLLKHLDLQGIRKKSKAAYGCLGALCDKFILQRLRDRESSLPRCGDLLDSFLDFSQENKAEFSLKHVRVLLVELFLAGTETNSNTVEWAMTELILNPKIMAKLRQEIAENVEAKGRIIEADIIGLSYLQAVIKETMRLHLVVPLLLPHKSEADVKVKGYTIPKNTHVLINAWAMARDPEYWESPDTFMPERFLGSELDFRGQHFAFLPFGSGRRMCPGMPLAQRVVSLMIASLVYHFEWQLPQGVTPENLDMNEKFGLTLERATPLLAVPIIPN